MRFRGKKPAAQKDAGSTTSRRPGKWRRRLLAVTIVVVVVGSLATLRSSFIQADGLVVGNNARISTPYRARITDVFFDCNDAVKENEILAKLESEEMRVAYTDKMRQLKEARLELPTSLVKMGEEVEILRQERRVADAKLVEATVTWNAYRRLNEKGILNRESWERANAELAAIRSTLTLAEVRLRGKLSELEFATQSTEVKRSEIDRSIAELEAAGPALAGNIVLTSPKTGLLSACGSRPGEIVAPGETIFSVFEPTSAFVRGFFDPDTARRLQHGMNVTVDLIGVGETFEAPIDSVESVVRGLPEELVRYFWQRPQWSQYLRVRISLENVPDHLRENIRFGARARLSIILMPEWLGEVKTGLTRIRDGS
jgi:multidrug resistance efflux pump